MSSPAGTRAIVPVLALGLGSAALVALLSWLPWAGPFLDTVEHKTYDRRLRLLADPGSARPDIVLVEINESTLRALEPVAGRWPWPRAVHAQVIDFLARAPARVIAYDVLFIERDSRSAFPYGEETMTGAESDAALVESVQAPATSWPWLSNGSASSGSAGRKEYPMTKRGTSSASSIAKVPMRCRFNDPSSHQLFPCRTSSGVALPLEQALLNKLNELILALKR